MTRKRYDLNTISRKNRNRLALAVRYSVLGSVSKSTMHGAVANEMLKAGLIVDMGDRYVVVIPWADAHRKASNA